MPVCSDTSSTAVSRSQMRGTSAMANPRNWICCRVVMSTNPVPQSRLSSLIGPELCGVRNAVGHPDAHHEPAGSLPPEEHAEPLQPLTIAVADALPSITRKLREVVGHIEAVSFLLDTLDLVRRLDAAVRLARTCDDSRGSAVSTRSHASATMASTSGRHEPQPVDARVASQTACTLRPLAAPPR